MSNFVGCPKMIYFQNCSVINFTALSGQRYINSPLPPQSGSNRLKSGKINIYQTNVKEL